MTLDLRVHPRARRTALESANGTLKVSVTAPPEDGKANDAVIALMAETWRLPKSSFDVVKGVSTRNKIISIAGEPRALAERISLWMAKHV